MKLETIMEIIIFGEVKIHPTVFDSKPKKISTYLLDFLGFEVLWLFSYNPEKYSH